MKSKTHLLKKALWLKNLFLTACLILVAMPVLSQTRTVTGTVTDTSGDALIGVSILVQGTSNGVVTDLDGKYTLTNVPENGTLTFSYICESVVDNPLPFRLLKCYYSVNYLIN